jgi:inorganic triphosphatase YgiF
LRGNASSKHVVSHYFDTPEQDLRRGGIGFRLRRKGDKLLQTVKREGRQQGGLAAREEHEVPIPEERPNADALGPFREELAPFLPRLEKVFTTQFQRMAWDLQRDGHHLELVLDEGEIVAGSHRQNISEVEIEKVSGSTSFLLETAGRLTGSVPLVPEILSKAARGYLTAEGRGLRPEDLKTPEDLQGDVEEKIKLLWQRYLQGLALLRYGDEEQGFVRMGNALEGLIGIQQAGPMLSDITALAAKVRGHHRDELLDSTLSGRLTLQVLAL